jgi:Ser/Thr protein kinase RdoA (MazF antagonist)
MNSSVWAVRASGGGRFVLKAARDLAPGLEVAALLEARGFPAGGAVPRTDGRLTIRLGELQVALLRFLPGRPLDAADPGDVRLVGRTLGRVHAFLVGERPEGLAQWPWDWLGQAERIENDRLREAATRAILVAAEHVSSRSLTTGVLHGDPAPEAFRLDERDGTVGLLDWGSALAGPLLYDLASAWMYTDSDRLLVEAYLTHAPVDRGELAFLADFLALRWAVQAAYFSWRIRDAVTTGLRHAHENEKGLADAARGLGLALG